MSGTMSQKPPPTTLTWIGGGNNQASNANDWSPATVPLSGDTLIMSTGTMNVSGNDLAGNALNLVPPSNINPFQAAINLSNATAGINFSTDNFTLTDTGTVNTSFTGGNGVGFNSTWKLPADSSLTLSGTADFVFGLTINGSGASFINNGAITIDPLGGFGSLTADLSGTGTFNLGGSHDGPATVELNGKVAAGLTFTFDGGPSGTNDLRIDKPLDFNALINAPAKDLTGHPLSQIITLQGLTATSYTFTNNLLTLFNGNTVADTVHLQSGDPSALSVFQENGAVELAFNSTGDAGTSLPMKQPLVTVSVSGTPQEGQTLTASSSNPNVAFHWQRSPDGKTWTDISGALGNTYVVAEADENDFIRAQAFISPSTSFFSDATARVTDVPPSLSVMVVYPVLIDVDSNNPTEGLTLTAVPKLTTDADNSVKDIGYQWQRSADGSTWNDIRGATANTYVAAEADEGDTLRVIASFTDDTNQSIKATSDPTPKVVDVRPSLAISISGDTQEGSTLTAAPKLTTDEDDSVKDVTYQWQRSPDNGKTWNNIDGATNITYQTVAADDNDLIRNEASFTDDTGQNAGADSNTIGPIQKPQPVPNHIQEVDTTTGKALSDPGVAYNGPVKGIDWQWIVPADIINDNLNITALARNMFIATGHGDDAIDVSKTNGTNILDGSTGSNFMTGGSGDDTFFVDDRGATNPIWTTIRGLHSGDDVTIWGLTQSDFQQMKMGNDVLPIAPGLDFALSEKGKPDVNVTLTGFSTNDMRNGKLSINFGHTQDTQQGTGLLAGSDYMQVHVN